MDLHFVIYAILGGAAPTAIWAWYAATRHSRLLEEERNNQRVRHLSARVDELAAAESVLVDLVAHLPRCDCGAVATRRFGDGYLCDCDLHAMTQYRSKPADDLPWACVVRGTVAPGQRSARARRWFELHGRLGRLLHADEACPTPRPLPNPPPLEPIVVPLCGPGKATRR
jgi:hypothetical protein